METSTLEKLALHLVSEGRCDIASQLLPMPGDELALLWRPSKIFHRRIG